MNDKYIKNKKNILREFDKDKYGFLLDNIDTKTSLEDCDQLLHKQNSRRYISKKILKNKKIIEKYIYKYSQTSNTIIEMGCGYGSIGLHLMKCKKFDDKKFIFMDISRKGLAVLNKIAKNLNINKHRYKTGYVDIFNCIKQDDIRIPKDSTIFTYQTMVYRKKHNKNFINFFLKLNFKYLVFIEPIYEHNLKNFDILNYIEKNNYTQNLLTILKKEKRINLTFEKKNIFFSHKFFPFSLIIVEKSSKLRN